MVTKKVEIFKKGEKGEKERAEKLLRGTKGVTVIGKGEGGKKVDSKKRKRTNAEDDGRSGVSFKL